MLRPVLGPVRFWVLSVSLFPSGPSVPLYVPVLEPACGLCAQQAVHFFSVSSLEVGRRVAAVGNGSWAEVGRREGESWQRPPLARKNS